MFYIKKAEKVIDEKQRESNERQKNLEILSAKMITAQEDEKKRISSELHEDVVQTITAVKLQLEQCVSSAEQNHSNVPVEVPFHIIPILQESISKIRSLSINLRPPSLDDFGLKAATNTLVSEFNSMPSKLKIRVSIDVNEEALGEDKKSILYRILKDTLKMISIHRNTEGEIQVRLSINHQSGNLKLAINFENNESKYMDLVSNDLCDTPDFEMMRESTILSGGSFKVFKDTAGSIKASSEWEVA
jgi:signal transduction histidine kinase